MLEYRVIDTQPTADNLELIAELDTCESINLTGWSLINDVLFLNTSLVMIGCVK